MKMKKVANKLVTALLTLVLVFVIVSCDDSKTLPEEITVSVWDGETKDTSWYSDDKNEFVLSDASSLAGLAELVNKGKTFEGKTVTLGININLNDKQWTPIGLYSDENDSENFDKKKFSGTFDGKDHTIIGLSIVLDNGKSSYRALFGYVDGKVCNLIVEGKVVACDSSGIVAALDDGGVIENVVSKVDLSVTKANSADFPQAKVAGIVVAVKNKKGGTTGCTIRNCKNYGSITSSADNAQDAVGGILAWSDISKLTIENCENYGKITAGKLQNAGGIIGEVRPGNNTTFTIKLTDCANKGTITVSESKKSGGIIGRIVGSVKPTLTGCTTTGDYELVGEGTYNKTESTK